MIFNSKGVATAILLKEFIPSNGNIAPFLEHIGEIKKTQLMTETAETLYEFFPKDIYKITKLATPPFKQMVTRKRKGTQ